MMQTLAAIVISWRQEEFVMDFMCKFVSSFTVLTGWKYFDNN